MSKILITGCSGQIGSDLIPLLITRYGKENLIGVDINPDQNSEIRIENISVTSKSELNSLIKQNNVTELYHLAAILSAKGEQNPDLAWEVNLNGTKNIFDLAVEHKIKVFWPSTIAVFGASAPRQNTPQEAIRRPSTMYGITKVAGENLCEYYIDKFGADIRSVRFPGIISYKTEPGGGTTDYAVAIFFDAIAKNNYNCFVKKDTMLPMMYMEDALRSIMMIMDAPKESLTVHTSYNLSALSFTVEELNSEINKHLKCEVEYTPDFRQKIADSWPQSIDDSLARKDWGWKESFALDKLVTEMINGIRNK